MDTTSFFKITYGLYILSSVDGEQLNGHINNTVFQVTAEPPRFAVASHKDNLTTDYIKKSGVFAVSVLSQDVDLAFLGPWGFQSGREVNKFNKVNYRLGKTGAPIVLDRCLAFMECEVEQVIDTGTHMLFIGKVIDADHLEHGGAPLSYAYYREVIKGISPENSPTYINKKDDAVEVEDSAEAMEGQEHSGSDPPASAPSAAPVEKKAKKYQCRVCGFIYDPEEGDPPAGISPGTAFEDIPDDWYCPICGVTKKDFDPVD